MQPETIIQNRYAQRPVDFGIDIAHEIKACHRQLFAHKTRIRHHQGNLRETFFFNQTRVAGDVISSSVSDFVIGDHTFEVGGKRKKQIETSIRFCDKTLDS